MFISEVFIFKQHVSGKNTKNIQNLVSFLFFSLTVLLKLLGLNGNRKSLLYQTDELRKARR